MTDSWSSNFRSGDHFGLGVGWRWQWKELGVEKVVVEMVVAVVVVEEIVCEIRILKISRPSFIGI